MFPELKVTDDGSHTLWVANLDETYHSMHGALEEALHVFIDNGLRHRSDTLNENRPLHILEIGLGTGLNAWLSYIFASKNKLKITYTSLEPNPLSNDLLSQLNYTKLPSLEQYKTYFEDIHKATWGPSHHLNNYFSLRKIDTALQRYREESHFDLIFYDAFAPSKQPEMWEAEIFQELAKHMKSGSVLVSYCAQGQFRRNLKAQGLLVEILEGPPGKKEMTRATRA